MTSSSAHYSQPLHKQIDLDSNGDDTVVARCWLCEWKWLSWCFCVIGVVVVRWRLWCGWCVARWKLIWNRVCKWWLIDTSSVKVVIACKLWRGLMFDWFCRCCAVYWFECDMNVMQGSQLLKRKIGFNMFWMVTEIKVSVYVSFTVMAFILKGILKRHVPLGVYVKEVHGLRLSSWWERFKEGSVWFKWNIYLEEAFKIHFGSITLWFFLPLFLLLSLSIYRWNLWG